MATSQNVIQMRDFHAQSLKNSMPPAISCSRIDNESDEYPPLRKVCRTVTFL
jgi:hypothetical protein